MDVDDEEASGVPLRVARIAAVRKHPNADKLKVCDVDAGGKGTVQVVCGGANAREGLLVIFAAVGSVVPASGEALKEAKLRGVESFGMLCSAKEMGWADEADGVFELPASFADKARCPAQRPRRGGSVPSSGSRRDFAASVGAPAGAFGFRRDAA